MSEEILKSLASDYGLIGLLFAGALVLIGILFRLLLLEKDKRIQDAKNVNEDIATPLAYIKDSLALINEKVRVSKKAERDDI